MISLSLSNLSILNSFVVGFLWSPVVIVYKLSSWWSVQWPTKKYVQIDSQWNYTDLNNLLLLLLLLQRIPKMKKNNIRSQNLWNHFLLWPQKEQKTHTHIHTYHTVLISWNFEYIIIRSQLLLIRKNPVVMRFYILISLMHVLCKNCTAAASSFCLLSKLLYNMFLQHWLWAIGSVPLACLLTWLLTCLLAYLLFLFWFYNCCWFCWFSLPSPPST